MFAIGVDAHYLYMTDSHVAENTVLHEKHVFGKINTDLLKIVRFSIRNHRWKAKDLYYANPSQIREN